MADYLKIKSGIQIGGPNSPITLRVIDTSSFSADSSALASVLAIESFVQSRTLDYFIDTSLGNPQDNQIILYDASLQRWTTADTIEASVYSQVYIDGSLLARDASISQLYNEHVSIDASIVRIDSSILQLFNQLGYSDSSINEIWNEFINVNSSLNEIWINLEYIDSSISDIWIQFTNVDGSITYNINQINQLDASIQRLEEYIDGSLNLKVDRAGDTMTGQLAITGGGLQVGTIGSPFDTSLYSNLYVHEDLTIGGDLFIDGSLFVRSVETIDVSSSYIILNTGQTGPPPSSMQSGIVIDRGDTSLPYVLVYDESNQSLRIGFSELIGTSYSDASTQSVATREDTPTDTNVAYWDNTTRSFKTDSFSINYVVGVMDVSITQNTSDIITNISNISINSTSIGYLDVSIDTLESLINSLEASVALFDASLGNYVKKAGDTMTGELFAPNVTVDTSLWAYEFDLGNRMTVGNLFNYWQQNTLRVGNLTITTINEPGLVYGGRDLKIYGNAGYYLKLGSNAQDLIDLTEDASILLYNLSDSSTDYVIYFNPETSALTYGLSPEGGTVITSLGDIGDVSVSDASQNQVLTWDGNYWIPADVSTSGGVGLTVVETSVNITAGNNQLILVDVSDASVNITLPSSSNTGDIIQIVDITKNSSTNNIFINTNGHTIDFYSEDFIIDVNGGSIEFVYDTCTNNYSLINLEGLTNNLFNSIDISISSSTYWGLENSILSPVVGTNDLSIGGNIYVTDGSIILGTGTSYIWDDGNQLNIVTGSSTNISGNLNIDGSIYQWGTLFEGTGSGVSQDYVDGSLALKVNKSGDTMTGSLFVDSSLYVSGGGTIDGSLRVSSQGVGSSTGLWFGDGDSGFYESTDDLIELHLDGEGRFRWSQDTFGGWTAGTGAVRNSIASATNPSLCPNRSDLDTGLGRSAANQLSLIAGGVEGIRIDSSTAGYSKIVINPGNTTYNTSSGLFFGDGDTGFYEYLIDDYLGILVGGLLKYTIGAFGIDGAVSNGPRLANTTPTNTTPSFLPSKGDGDTGMGWATNQVSLIAGGIEGIRIDSSTAGHSKIIINPGNTTYNASTGLWFGDGDAGIHEYSDDKLSIYAEELYINASVGIGTKDPSSALHIIGGAPGTTNYYNGIAIGTNGNYLYESAAGTITLRANNNVAVDFTNTITYVSNRLYPKSDILYHLGSAALRWQSFYSQNITDDQTTVGIKTLDPCTSYSLDVSGNLNVDGSIYLWGTLFEGTGSGVSQNYVDGSLALKANLSYVDSSLTGYVNKSGDTMTGRLKVDASIHVDGGIGAIENGILFGDGDTGFYESADDTLKLMCAGFNFFQFAGTGFAVGTGSGTNVIRTNTSTSTIPAFTWANDTDTGMGHGGLDILSFIVDGVQVIRIDSSTSGHSRVILNPGGEVGASTGLWFGDNDTGIYEKTDDSLYFAQAGVDRWIMNGNTLYGSGAGPALVRTSAGGTVPTVLPNYSDTDTGMGKNGANQVTLVAGGIEVLRIDASSEGHSRFRINPNGEVGASTGIWFGDGDSGIYEYIDDVISFNLNGAERVTFSSSGINSAGGALLSTNAASTTIPSIAPANTDTDTGLGRAGTNQLSLIAGGVEGMRIDSSTLGYSKIILNPTESVGASTGLWFGDGDTGIYENVDDTLSIVTANTEIARIGSELSLYYTPSDSSSAVNKYYVDQALTDASGSWVQKSGDIMTGRLQVDASIHINVAVGSYKNGLLFGDGDTGIYEFLDDQLAFYVQGSDRWYMVGNYFRASSGPAFIRSSVAGVPNILPDYADTNTGIAPGGSDKLILIAGSKTLIHLDTTTVGIKTVDPCISYSLDVSGNLNVDGSIYLQDILIDEVLVSKSAPADASDATEIRFDNTIGRVYGTIESPLSGDITVSASDALLGVTNLIIHNDSSLSFPEWTQRLTGVYGANVNNFIYIQYIDPSNYLYTINQIQ